MIHWSCQISHDTDTSFLIHDLLYHRRAGVAVGLISWRFGDSRSTPRRRLAVRIERRRTIIRKFGKTAFRLFRNSATGFLAS
jgi:hypothetical protein